MPWTFAHPAAVLPLHSLFQRRLPLGALTVGSMTPDFGYYVGCFGVATRAHTLWGLIAICLPSGLVMLELIHFFHRPIANVMPSAIRQRLLSISPIQRVRSGVSLFYVSSALVFGALTHIAWDSFTHRSGYLALHWPILLTPILSLGGRSFRLCEVLQHLSTIIGCVILISVYRQWSVIHALSGRRQGIKHDRWRYQFLAIVAMMALALGATVAYIGSTAHQVKINVMLFIVRLAIASTTVFVGLLCVSSLALSRRATKHSEQ